MRSTNREPRSAPGAKCFWEGGGTQPPQKFNLRELSQPIVSISPSGVGMREFPGCIDYGDPLLRPSVASDVVSCHNEEAQENGRWVIVMKAYETLATVEERGQVHVAGVPFAPGTQVGVTISPIAEIEAASVAGEASRAVRLLAALDKARNVQPIGTFKRAELYDRSVLR
jgi:hypothetical protein